MAFIMKNIFNATEEIAMSAPYTDIRFSVLPLLASSEEQSDITPKIGWPNSSDSAHLALMTSVCFLFARNIYDVTGVPIGLIDSSWGGTRIEAWSTQESLESCDIPDNVSEDKPQDSNSYLWNSMIAPLKKLSIKGFLWYQGEANSHWNFDNYNCTFPSLIESWRKEFSSRSFTSPSGPIGFVQLSTIKYGHDSTYPLLRLHQTTDYGFVPNTRMEKVFMAVAVDTYDEENGIHPRYKQIIGERLAYTGLNVAYGLEDFPERGPQVAGVSVSVSRKNHKKSLISFSRQAEWS
jgi:sialate O-acetylesterase